jgi:hypothetical protein
VSTAFGVGGAGVGEKLAVDGVGDATLEAAHGFHPGLARGEFAPVVGAVFGIEAAVPPRATPHHGTRRARRPEESHTNNTMGSREESIPAEHLDRVRPDTGPHESSSSRECRSSRGEHRHTCSSCDQGVLCPQHVPAMSPECPQALDLPLAKTRHEWPLTCADVSARDDLSMVGLAGFEPATP